MKLTTGYKKPIASSGTDALELSSNNSYLLLAGGGHKALSELVSPADLTNYVTIGSNLTITGVKTFSLAINADITGNADTVDGYHADDILPYGLENLCVGAVRAGAQTTLNSDGSITTSGNNSDTYFYVRCTEDLKAGQIYTVGFYVTGVPSGNTGTWSWPFYSQNNNNLVVLITSNGWCWGTGTIPRDVAAGTDIIFDDGRHDFCNSINISKFVIVKGRQKAYYTPPISKMSVNYATSATSAGNADTVDNKHASDFVLSTDFAIKELNSNLTTITKTLTVTKEWMDTGIKHTDLTTGTYAVQVSSYTTDNLIWDGYWSGIMTWYGGTTNASESDEIILHRGAHAYNGNTIYLRTVNSTYEDGRNMRLQIAANKNFNSATYKFKFKKLI